MSYNRKVHLSRLHSERKEITKTKVDKAIQQLIKNNKFINFNSVANVAGISKTTLYNNLEFKERIISLRNQEASATLNKKVSVASENSKDALIASLKRKIKKLDEENIKFKTQLKIYYGEVYKSI